MEQNHFIKPPVEVRYREELDVLRALDTGRKPENWQLSPKAVRTFILGSRTPLEYEGKSYSIQKKYFGNDALVERCIVTLAGNRGLMLVGEPGTAKPCFPSFCRPQSAESAPTPFRERRGRRRI